MLEVVDPDIIRISLPRIKNGLKKYLILQDALYTCDVSRDRDFQRTYNGFYRMRQRKPEFYHLYYGYMEKHKQSEITFDAVLKYIYDETKRIEASFSSKLLATINPDMPVWDVNVLSNLGITAPRYKQQDRYNKTVDTYIKLQAWYGSYLDTHNARDAIEIFDRIYPDTEITAVKKIDLILWSLGEKD